MAKNGLVDAGTGFAVSARLESYRQCTVRTGWDIVAGRSTSDVLWVLRRSPCFDNLQCDDISSITLVATSIALTTFATLVANIGIN